MRGEEGAARGRGGLAVSVPAPPLKRFAALSAWTLVGPVVIFVVGAGGASRRWPPDRAVEWWVFGAVTLGYAILLVATLSAAWGSRPRRPERGTGRALREEGPARP